MITQDPNPRYNVSPSRYESMQYKRCGQSGLLLPRLALGLWQNFGAVDPIKSAREMLCFAFDNGITHFDLANNYGPNYGSSESTFGQIMANTLKPWRDELIISSKAGYDMWAGPYGVGGSRKYLIASCDQSLKRTGLDYFDIFYHHCEDPDTPLEESMQALDYIVRSGRALYVGVSNYSQESTQKAITILKQLGTPLLAHQPKYNLFHRDIEAGLSDLLIAEGVGGITFSPLAQGLLTDKYIDGIPEGSRASRSEQIYLNSTDISDQNKAQIVALNELAKQREQSLAQMSIAWVLNNAAVTTCLLGASSTKQIADSLSGLKNLSFSSEELSKIDSIVSK